MKILQTLSTLKRRLKEVNRDIHGMRVSNLDLLDGSTFEYALRYREKLEEEIAITEKISKRNK